MNTNTLLNEYITRLPYSSAFIEAVMLDALHAAMRLIRQKRSSFRATNKDSGYKDVGDIVTDADIQAQMVYRDHLQNNFPEVGIVGEEESLQIACTLDGVVAYFTIDPLDGTKAFARGQSDGVGTMLSLVVDGQVVAAYVGDINSGDIYGYCTHPEKAPRVTRFLNKVDGYIDYQVKPLCKQRCFLISEIDNYPDWVHSMVMGPNRLFSKGFSSLSGSIGTNTARLWKGEMGMIIVNPSAKTSWDFCPVWGISKMLDFNILVELGLVQGCYGFAQDTIPSFGSKPERTTSCRIIVHSQNVAEFDSWLKEYVNR